MFKKELLKPSQDTLYFYLAAVLLYFIIYGIILCYSFFGWYSFEDVFFLSDEPYVGIVLLISLVSCLIHAVIAHSSMRYKKFFGNVGMFGVTLVIFVIFVTWLYSIRNAWCGPWCAIGFYIVLLFLSWLTVVSVLYFNILNWLNNVNIVTIVSFIKIQILALIGIFIFVVFLMYNSVEFSHLFRSKLQNQIDTCQNTIYANIEQLNENCIDPILALDKNGCNYLYNSDFNITIRDDCEERAKKLNK